MSLLADRPLAPRAQVQNPTISRQAATVVIVAALFTLLCAGASLAFASVIPLVGAGIALLVAVALSCREPSTTFRD